ncbi:MAG: fatty acyl-AMP ligase [Gammaproteobacteria bacterium]
MVKKMLLENNLPTLLRHHVSQFPEKIAYLFLENGEVEADKISFYELDKAVSIIANVLTSINKEIENTRVILLFPPGIDFIIAFLSCLYAKAIAVPVCWPSQASIDADILKLKTIIDETGAQILLAPQGITKLENKLHLHNSIDIINITPLRTAIPVTYALPKFYEDTVMYLQFTSGSTSAPKGVIVTHGNVTKALCSAFDLLNYTEHSISLTWALHTHVYGLLYCLLLPLYKGTLSIIMPPSSFIAKPVRWLQAISKYGATHSGTSNFGYDVCVSRIQEKDIKNVELKTWEVAINGGEPIQRSTLLNFYNKFKPYGFALESFVCCYGMSEATGLIACNRAKESVQYINLDSKALQHHLLQINNENDSAQTFLAYPNFIPEMQITIGDAAAATKNKTNSTNVGEIYLTAPTCSSGYWNQPAEKMPTNLSTHSNYFTINTGDIGCMIDGKLVVLGRLKELICINGKYYYPLNIETTASTAFSKLIVGNNAVFVISEKNQEEICLIQVIDSNIKAHEYLVIVEAIRSAVFKKFNLKLDTIMLIADGQLARTPSGKIQRGLCKRIYLNKGFKILHESRAKNLEYEN